MHSLVAGEGSFSTWSGWTHGLLTIGAGGQGAFSSVVTSGGGNTSNNEVSLSISSDGIITVSGDDSYFGFLSDDKSLVIATMTDGNGGYCLAVAQKKP
jgi:hypothetical protein